MSVLNQNFDLLSAVKNTQTPVYLSLLGFRKSISRHLGLKALPLLMYDDTKAVLRRIQSVDYPYGYFRLNSFDIPRDSQVNKTLRRHGSTLTLDEVTNATISKGYLFPCTLMVEFHFIHNDPQQVLNLVEKSAILGAVDGFSFTVEMEGTSGWTVGVMMEEGPIQIPIAELESETDASAFDVIFNFSIKTRAGIVKSVPKINNEGRISRDLGIQNLI